MVPEAPIGRRLVYGAPPSRRRYAGVSPAQGRAEAELNGQRSASVASSATPSATSMGTAIALAPGPPCPTTSSCAPCRVSPSEMSYACAARSPRSRSTTPSDASALCGNANPSTGSSAGTSTSTPLSTPSPQDPIAEGLAAAVESGPFGSAIALSRTPARRRRTAAETAALHQQGAARSRQFENAT
jgi:hypothetical protein